MKLKQTCLNLVLVFVSLVIALAVLELSLRLILDPVDYLEPYLYSDYRLKHVVKPHSSGHDRWGFRNRSVPARTDLVANGDSQTYGVSAQARYSWPAALAKETGKDVYNMGLGGYGPAQYLFLLKEKAFQLQPNIIIAGLYLGNDILDAYEMISMYEYWDAYKDKDKSYTNEHVVGEKPAIVLEDGAATESFGDWLGHYSIVYRIVKDSALTQLYRWYRVNRSSGSDGRIVTIESKAHDVRTAFKDGYRLKALDVERPEVRDGIEKTKRLLSEMHSLCGARGIPLVILIIPTKESVYADFFDPEADRFRTLLRTVACEDRIREEIKSYLSANRIPFVDALPCLKENPGNPMVYPSTTGGHPNRYGYALIAKALGKYLKDHALLP